MKIVLHPAWEETRAFIRSIPDCFASEGELIFQGRNQLKRFQVGGKSLIVKSFRPPHLINRIVYATFRSSKACRSYTYGLRLQALGISTPAPVAYLEEYRKGLVRSYYVSEEVTGVKEIRDFWENPVIGARRPYLDAFGRFTADMHEKQVLHLDYSAGNVLYGGTTDLPLFYLVDINRLRFNRPVTEEEGYRSFRRLWLTDEAYTAIALAYAAARGYDPDHAVERIRFYKNRYMRLPEK